MSEPIRSMRTLVLMRHSKAEPAADVDFERHLSRQGRRDAALAGGWLAAQSIVADCAVVSAAMRTRQTWSSVAHDAGWSVTPVVDEGLYTADPETALDLLRGLDDACHTAVMIGHNPTMGSLAQLLDNGEGDAEAGTSMAIGFPTCAIAVLAYEGPWGELAPATARVTGFHVARA